MTERIKLTYEQAVALLPEGDEIHTYLSDDNVLVGADWDRDSVLDLLREGAPELAGPAATKAGHGLVAFRADGPVFIATQED